MSGIVTKLVRRGVGLLLCTALLVTAVLAFIFIQWQRNSLNSSPIDAQTLSLARAGVSRNDQWTPVLRTLSPPLEMALVPAGCFLMGSTDEQLAPAQNACTRYYGSIAGCQQDFSIEQPAHKVCFGKPFWIGTTEISNQQYGSNSSSDMVEMYRGPDWPRDTMTWQEASEFCERANLRLPTEAEWEYAARGPDGLTYPWGNEFEPAYSISGVLNPMDVGHIPEGRSWVGAYDMSGSILEWVSDWYAPYDTQEQVDPQGPATGELRVARGGSWFSFAPFFVRSTQRYPQDPNFASSNTGFRCAADFE
jgi:formylglycine-generating enzyme required for sulfatase activity